MRRNGIHDLLSQIFDEDQRSNEDISLSDIRAEIGVIAVVAKFLDQVPAQLNPEIATGSVESGSRLGQRVLVLRLKNHVNRFHHGTMVLTLSRSNSAIGGADLREHRRVLSNVKNHTVRSGPWRRFPYGRYTNSPIGFGAFAALQ